MKTLVYLFAIYALSACASIQNYDTIMEDDIYYTPSKKNLYQQEVEMMAGEVNHPTTRTVAVEDQYAEENGYWIGGFTGNDADFKDAVRIINMYPLGFASMANGEEIAASISFSSDWNVYTCNGRYWWFPTPTNYSLYSTFLFGRYPQMAWTVAWNDPMYNSWAFDYQFGWGLRTSWNVGGAWSLGLGLGWNSLCYDPWYYGGFYDPWYNGYYGYHHHHYHDHWYHGGFDGGFHGNYRHRSTGQSLQRPGATLGSSRSGGSRSASSYIRPGTTSSRVGEMGTSTYRRSSGNATNTSSRVQGTSSYNRTSGVVTDRTTGRPSSYRRPTSTGTSGTTGTSSRYTRPSSSTTTTNQTSTNYTRPASSNVGVNSTTRTQTTYTRPSSNSRNAATRPSTTYTRPSSNVGTNSTTRTQTTYTRPSNNYRNSTSTSRNISGSSSSSSSSGYNRSTNTSGSSSTTRSSSSYSRPTYQSSGSSSSSSYRSSGSSSSSSSGGSSRSGGRR